MTGGLTALWHAQDKASEYRGIILEIRAIMMHDDVDHYQLISDVLDRNGFAATGVTNDFPRVTWVAPLTSPSSGPLQPPTPLGSRTHQPPHYY